MLIRKAVIDDVHGIHEILNYYADKDILLARSLSEIYDHLREYYVLVDEEQGRIVQGVCGLGICWEDLAEIRSLAVSEDIQCKGSGSQLVEMCLKEAASLGLKRVFVLTYVPEFFKKIGFEEVDKSVLPHKIWADCIKCPKFPNCDETAMMIDL
jgi:amino-acid N-acetyltransferase